jgi:hypothetical protein
MTAAIERRDIQPEPSAAIPTHARRDRSHALHAPPQPTERIAHLHQSLGNQGVQRLLQRKLSINQPGDACEQEADRVAAAVTADPLRQTPQAPSINSAPPAPLQRKCSCGGTYAECREEEEVQRKEASGIAVAGSGAETLPIVDDALRSPGQPLDPATRAYFEPRFGRDFSEVRVHANRQAAESARAVNALAYTVGRDVVFDPGKYKPETAKGRHLLAHELAHVVQQSRGGQVPATFDSSGPLERDADRAAAQLSHGNRASVAGASAPGVARQENAELPWWKRKLNPLYQKALTVLPKPLADKVEEVNEAAKALVQHGGVTDDQINTLVKAAEPILKPAEDILGVTPPPDPPPGPPAPVYWIGTPPISVRLEQERQRKKALDEAKKTAPLALEPPAPRPRGTSATDLLGIDPLKPDPPPTEFEKKLRSGQPFSHTLIPIPTPDIDPTKAHWLGSGPAPTAEQLAHMRFEAAGSLDPSVRIFVPGAGSHTIVQIDPAHVAPVRDPETHELKGYRLRTGETVWELDRDGIPLYTRGLEAPLEAPYIDPVDIVPDIVLLATGAGPIAKEAIAAGGKKLVGAIAKGVLSAAEEEVVERGVRTTANQAARNLVDRYAGRLVDPNNAIAQIIERARSPTLRVDGRAAANELRGIVRILEGGIDGRAASVVEVVPSSSAGRTPDLIIRFADGTATRYEMRALTSAPRGYLTPKPGTSSGVLARGLAEETAERPVSRSQLTQAIIDKAKVTSTQPSQLTSPLAGVGPGGTISVTVMEAQTTPAMIDAAVQRAVPRLGSHVERIEVSYLLPRGGIADPLKQGTIRYIRQANGTYLRVP